MGDFSHCDWGSGSASGASLGLRCPVWAAQRRPTIGWPSWQWQIDECGVKWILFKITKKQPGNSKRHAIDNSQLMMLWFACRPDLSAISEPHASAWGTISHNLFDSQDAEAVRSESACIRSRNEPQWMNRTIWWDRLFWMVGNTLMLRDASRFGWNFKCTMHQFCPFGPPHRNHRGCLVDNDHVFVCKCGFCFEELEMSIAKPVDDLREVGDRWVERAAPKVQSTEVGKPLGRATAADCNVAIYDA